jgi:uncharacterized protein (DUF433 family)
MAQVIVRDPEIMHGMPVFRGTRAKRARYRARRPKDGRVPPLFGGTHPCPLRFWGTRVPVQTLFDYLAGGDTLEDFLNGFPTVSRDSAVQALEEAKQLLLAAS